MCFGWLRKKGGIMDDDKRVEPNEHFLKHHSVEKVETAQAGKKRTRVTDQRWADYYLKHGHINLVQHMAAEQLLALYRAAGRNQKMTGSLDGMPKGTGNDMSEYSANALMDYFKLKWMLGTESFGCVEDIIVHDYSAPEWAKKNSRNPKAATEILRMSLDHLTEAFKNLRSVKIPRGAS